MDMTEFQQRACAVAVVKMLGGSSFSICDLDKIAATMGMKSAMSGRDYDALHALHCVSWGDMGPELSKMVREKCIELLGIPQAAIYSACQRETKQEEPAHKPAKRLRLAFWK